VGQAKSASFAGELGTTGCSGRVGF
jgi:hypothetical protein